VYVCDVTGVAKTHKTHLKYIYRTGVHTHTHTHTRSLAELKFGDP